MLVLIRADASTTIGTGHIMRCLSLAQHYRQLGAKVHFICKALPGNLNQALTNQGFPVSVLPQSANSEQQSGYARWLGGSQQQDLEQTIRVIQGLGQKPDLLIVDHYALDSTWEANVSSFVGHIMVIDDLANRQHSCSFLVDQSPLRSSKDYQALVHPDCQLLLGNKFSMLNPAYQSYRRRAVDRRLEHKSTKRLLLNFGGSDEDNLTLTCLRLLDGSPLPSSVYIDVVVGAAYAQLADLKEYANSSRFKVSVSQAVSDMPQRQLAADIAIGAAGGSAWERCYLGLPSICFCMAENQQSNIEALRRHKVAVILAKMAQAELNQALALLHKSYAELSHSAFELVDGHGVERIVHAGLVVQNLVGNSVYLQRVNASDAEQLFTWQTHPDTRQHSNTPAPPTWQEHLSWFQRALKDPNEYIYLAKTNDASLGCVRLTQQVDSSMLISIYCAPEHYRQGNAYAMLELIRRCFPKPRFEAQVKPENLASQKLFAKAGFQQVKPDYWIQEIES